MASIALPKFIVIKSQGHPKNGNVHYDANGSVLRGEQSVFSDLVKIEVERATSNDKYVNLRFCSSNKYWQANESYGDVVAKSNKPQEDAKKPSCTLFEPVKVNSGTFFLRHVSSGHCVLLRKSDMALYVGGDPASKESGFLTFVDWDTLVKLPEHVAFRHRNVANDGYFLKAVIYDKQYYLKFDSEEPNDKYSGHRVFQMPDGHIRIKSDHWGYWRRSPNWIWADSNDHSADDIDTLFWPVRIDENNIALRNAGNNNFCKPLSANGKDRCLNAAATSMTSETNLTVKELVTDKKVYNVRYRKEDSRIHGETPYVAGDTTVTNKADEKATVAVEISYQDQSSYSFKNSLSITGGVKTAFDVGVPCIVGGKIDVSFEIKSTNEWGRTTTRTSTVKASGAVTVPARSKAVVRYVGTMGTCDVPFTYTQQVRSSVDGSVTETDLRDGVFTGVNCYNFDFVMEKPQPLSQ